MAGNRTAHGHSQCAHSRCRSRDRPAERFDWKSVAASAAGGTAGSALAGCGRRIGPRHDQRLAAGTAAAVARGGRISLQKVATDAFGNALGQSIAAVA